MTRPSLPMLWLALWCGILTSPARQETAQTEPELIRVLTSSASNQEKTAACARLKVIGTKACIPALAGLLPDEALSHSARYALEPMSDPAAGEALLNALPKTTGAVRVGIIISLSIRREPAAVAPLTSLLSASDTETAVAAATALGRIGGTEAAHALEAASKTSTGQPHLAQVDGLFRCATALGNTPSAHALYQNLFDTAANDGQKLAACRGLLLTAGDRQLPMLVDAIRGADDSVRKAALQFVRDTTAPGATKAFCDLLPGASPGVQVALVEGLGQRGDPAAAPDIARLAQSSSEPVRLSVYTVLGRLGDDSVISLLAAAAAQGSRAEQAAARASLAELNRGPVAETLVRALPSAPAPIQAELARALGERHDVVAVPKLLELAANQNGSARAAALQAVASLVEPPQVPALLTLVIKAPDAEGRNAAADALRQALQSLSLRHGQVDLSAVTDAARNSSPDIRAALLPVCASFSTPDSRAAVRSAQKDSEPAVRTAAARALCDTTDPEMLPDTAALATGAADETVRTLAITACVRLTTEEETAYLPLAPRVAIFKEIASKPLSAEQKRQVLAALEQLPDPSALPIAQNLFSDPAVQPEAARALAAIADALPDTKAAEAALKQASASAADPGVRTTLEAGLKQLRGRMGFLTAWQASGPYIQAGKDFAALFDTPFAPELPDKADGAQWQPLLVGLQPARPYVMDLLKAFGGNDRVAYARTWVRSPDARPARLEVGADDGVKVWVNGKLVHAFNAPRALTVGSDKMDVSLKAGWNAILLKVSQLNQGWEFCARLVDPSGKPLEDLESSAAPPL